MEAVEILITENKQEVVFACIITGIVIIAAIYGAIRVKTEKAVRETSARYRKVLCINEKYEPLFENIEDQKKYIKLKSKAQYDKFDYFKQMNSQMEELIPLIQAVWKNRELFDSYQQEISTAPPLEDRDGVKKFKIPFFLYHDAEERVVESELLYPAIEITYTCEIRYTSPRGRNSYVDAKVFSFDKLESEYKLYLIRQQKKKSTKSRKNISGGE